MPSTKSFQEAESIYDRATRLEFDAEFKSAFRLYLEATDAFLRLSRSAVATPAFQARCRENASKAIQRAEKIKKASKTLGAKIGVVTASFDAFGPDHQAYVLRQSSTINNIRYPLWNEPVSLPLNPETHYSDPNGQPAIAAAATITWQRPLHDPFTPREPSQTLTPADIEQNIVDDCSVCASVAVCVQHNQRFNLTINAYIRAFLSKIPFAKLLSSSLLPGNQLGRYDLRAYLNGDFRRRILMFRALYCNRLLNPLHHQTPFVSPFTPTLEAIDDLLPYDITGRPVGISSGQNGVTWPALIEKAYMKLMGGYDFPGSNSSIDLRVLTGWIPEHIELQSTSFERERTWERIVNGFQKGYCVLTVGTDAKTMLKIEGVKLLPSHDYAVVDIRETKSERWLTLIDSRVPATSPSFHPERENGSDLSNSRTLDMRWDDICATFEGIYVSWNPSLFQNNVNLHGVWKPTNADDNAQESVRYLRLLYEWDGPDGGDDPPDTRKDIWILLAKHFSQTRRGTEYISLTVHPEDEDDWRDIRVKTGYAEVKGPYTTSPHVLVRTKVGKEYPTPLHSSPPNDSISTKISGAFSILASYDGPFDDVFFTVNVFCGADVRVWWEEAGTGNSISPRGGGFCTKVDGTLTTKNAGGNHTHPTYMLNPQWHLRIYDDNTRPGGNGSLVSNGHASSVRGFSTSSKKGNGTSKVGQKSVMVLSVQGPRDVPLNVTAVWSSGKRIVELAQKEVATSSGAYTYGRARAVADMAPGDYTVILSAFEPQVHLGQFTLKVESSRQFDFAAIPQEGAGMYTRASKGEWDGHTAVGGPSHGRYHLNPIYEIQVSSSAQLSARLHLTSPAPIAALNLSLFPASTSTSATPTLGRPMASSGPYSDALSGVYIPPRTLSPGRYWLVPSTFAAGVHASFRLVVYCSDSRCVVSRRRS